MSLKADIQQDLKEAQLKQAEVLISTLRMLLSAIHNKEIEKRTKLSKTEPVEKLEELSKLTDDEIIEAISSEIKKRKEAISEYSVHGGSASAGEKGKIENIINKEKQELEILQKYLPEQFSEEEIKKLVQEAVEKTGAKEMKDMGKVMADLMSKVKGKAEGSLVSKIVKETLS